MGHSGGTLGPIWVTLGAPWGDFWCYGWLLGLQNELTSAIKKRLGGVPFFTRYRDTLFGGFIVDLGSLGGHFGTHLGHFGGSLERFLALWVVEMKISHENPL